MDKTQAMKVSCLKWGMELAMKTEKKIEYKKWARGCIRLKKGKWKSTKIILARKIQQICKRWMAKLQKDDVKYIKYTEMLYFFLFCIQNEAGGCIHLMQSCGWNRKSAICNKEGR